MQTSQAQIKLNLPLPLKTLLSAKAERFGVPMASYIRHLIIQDVNEIPVYRASKETERAYRKAVNEYQINGASVINDVGEFIEKL